MDTEVHRFTSSNLEKIICSIARVASGEKNESLQWLVQKNEWNKEGGLRIIEKQNVNYKIKHSYLLKNTTLFQNYTFHLK